MSPQANTSSQKMQGAMYLKEECEMSCRVKTEREMVGGVCVYVCVCARTHAQGAHIGHMDNSQFP